MSTVKKAPALQDMMINLLHEYPNLQDGPHEKEAMRLFNQRYGLTGSPTMYYTAKRKIREGRAPAPKMIALPEPVTPVDAETTLPAPISSFVPDALYECIDDVQDVCSQAGGLDAAEAVARVIQETGGVDNFLATCRLLRKVVKPQHTPPRPTILPSDVNARM